MDAKYEIGELLGTGKFGAVFAGREKRTRTPVAIKLDNTQHLKYETTILNFLRHRGVREIPSVFWFGNYRDYKCLVMTFYERCLDQSMDAHQMKQCIRALKHIHRHGVLHRDIKPANWMVATDGQIHLIDFGLSTFYLDGDGGHVAKCDPDNIIGTPKFVSYYNHIGGNVSRRDDLISLGYMYLGRGNLRFLAPEHLKTAVPLPWSHLRATTTDIHHPINVEMRDMKQYERLEFPNREIANYMKHCYSLEYDSEPQYDLLCELF